MKTVQLFSYEKPFYKKTKLKGYTPFPEVTYQFRNRKKKLLFKFSPKITSKCQSQETGLKLQGPKIKRLDGWDA